jgi:pimeloyl-ACP methyl ester carboxylesterase
VSDQLTDVALALSARVGWANTLVAPSRLPSIPFQEKVKWIGSGAELSPYACAGSLFRPQDPEDLFRAGANGMPLLLLYGKEDRQMDGQKVYNALAPKFRVIERVALDNVGHMPFYELVDLTCHVARTLMFCSQGAGLDRQLSVGLCSSSQVGLYAL